MSELTEDKRIVFVGRGNVAVHLCRAFRNAGVDAVMCDPHAPADVPSGADMIVIAVTDDAIPAVVSGLPDTDAVVVHTSGSVPIDALDRFHNRGVLYPMQTFSKDVALDCGSISFFTESDLPEVLDRIDRFASLLSPSVTHADSRTRLMLHIASVFVCNFTNHMCAVADGLLRDRGLDFSVMIPLIRETVSKLEKSAPYDGQTGPAVRGDATTIARHMAALAGKGDASDLYRAVTNSIIAAHMSGVKDINECANHD